MKIVLANDSARARPNRWMGGRPGPHAPSEVSVLHATNTARHVGQKRRACIHNLVGGWGGKRIIYPRPRQVKSCHVTTPLWPTCAAALQKILTKQSKHVHVLADQALCLKERHVGPLLKSGKSCQHVARRTLKTAWCDPERSILKLLHTVQYRHAKTRMALVCWRP